MGKVLKWTGVIFCCIVVLYIESNVIFHLGHTLAPRAHPLSQFGIGGLALLFTGLINIFLIKCFIEAMIDIFSKKNN